MSKEKDNFFRDWLWKVNGVEEIDPKVKEFIQKIKDKKGVYEYEKEEKGRTQNKLLFQANFLNFVTNGWRKPHRLYRLQKILNPHNNLISGSLIPLNLTTSENMISCIYVQTHIR